MEDGARWVGWLEEGWRDRGGGAGLTGVSVEGWWLSVLSRSPEKKRKKKKETTTGSTDSTDFTKLQSRDTTERGTKS